MLPNHTEISLDSIESYLVLYSILSNQGGVDSTQFKAKKTVFRESQKPSKMKSDGGPQSQAFMDGWKCSTYQYLGHMQMRVSGVCLVHHFVVD